MEKGCGGEECGVEMGKWTILGEGWG